MGIDCNLYAIGDVSDERLSASSLAFADRFEEGGLTRDHENPRRVNAPGMSRYYRPGYERGPWPWIYAQIRFMFEAFPDCYIHYGGDTDWESQQVTVEDIDAIWAHWMSPEWDDYHKPLGDPS